MLSLWFISGLIFLVSLVGFLYAPIVKFYRGILLSFLFALSIQVGTTTFPDKYLVISSSGGEYSLYSVERVGLLSKPQVLQEKMSKSMANEYLNTHCNQDGANYCGSILEHAHHSSLDILDDASLIKVKSYLMVRVLVILMLYLLLILIAWQLGILGGSSPLYNILLNAHEFWTGLKRIEKALLLFFPWVFILSTTGVDINAFSQIINLNAHGVDIYFIQSILRLGIWKAEFAAFPYPIGASAIFTPFLTVILPVTNLLSGYSGWVPKQFATPEIFAMKLSIYYVYLSAAVVFSGNFKRLELSSRSLFYSFFFFPISFYMFGFYGHIDSLSLLFVVFFLVLLQEKCETMTLVLIVIVLMLTIKLQMLILCPILLIPLFFQWSQRFKFRSLFKLKTAIRGMLIVVLSFVLIFIPFLNRGLYITLFDYPQNARIWFTTLTYAPGLYFYFSFFVFLASIIAFVRIVEKCSNDMEVSIAVALGIGFTTLWFFATTIFTHSFLTVATPAFALVIALNSVSLIRKLAMIALSFMALFNLIFFNEGDISRILFLHVFSTSLHSVRFQSLMFTIAASAIILLGFMFYQAFGDFKRFNLVGYSKDSEE